MIKHYRSYLLEIFGIQNEYAAAISPNLRLKNRSESEPFGEIVTRKDGKTVLRVGRTDTDAPTLVIR